MPDNPFEPMIKNIGNYVSGTLYAQGVIPPIGIDNYEGLALASPADVHLLAAKDPVIDEIAVGMTGNMISGQTVSGVPPLSLPDSAGYPLQYWSVNVSPYQEGTGDPAPDNVRAIHGTNQISFVTTGKNLIDQDDSTYLNVQTRAYGNSDSDVVTQLNGLPAGTYTLSLKVKVTDLRGAPASHTYVGLYLRAINGGNTLNVNGQIGGVPTVGEVLSKSVTFTLTSEYVGKFVYCFAYTGKNNIVQPEVVYEGIIYDVQIELGSTATDYTPYVAPSQTVLTLPQTVYTGTIGSATGDSRSTIVDMGAQDWIYHSGFGVFYYVTPDGKPTGTGQGGYGMCEAYDVIEGTYYSNLTDGQIAVGTNFFSITTATVVVKDSRFTDAAQFKAAVSGIKLIYELSTPTTFAVPSVTIPTPTGTATTWTTAEDGTVDSMDVGYIENA